jgi:hypothetical protein
MGKLLQDINQPLPSRKTRIDRLIKELGADGPDLLTALKDPSIKSSQIHRALRNRGIVIGYTTIAIWRADNGVA